MVLRRDRERRDVETLTGRRGRPEDRALRWSDFEELLQRTLGSLTGVPSVRRKLAESLTPTFALTENMRDAIQTIETAQTFIANELEDARAEIATARTELEVAQEVIATDLDAARDEISGIENGLSRDIPKISTIEGSIANIGQILAETRLNLNDLRELTAKAGIYVDPATSSVRIAAFDIADERISSAVLKVDGLEAEISARVTFAEMNQAISDTLLDPTQIPIIDNLSLRITNAELAVDAQAGEITAITETLEVNGQIVTMSDVSLELDSLSGLISLKLDVSEFDALNLQSRLSAAEIQISSIDGPTITQVVQDSRSSIIGGAENLQYTIAGLLQAFQEGQLIRMSSADGRRELRAYTESADQALADEIFQIRAVVDQNTAEITQESITRSTQDSSLASQITTLSTQVGSAEAAIAQESIARSTEDSALAALIDSLTAELDGAQAAITQEATTRATQDGAISSLITSLSAELDDAQAAIAQESITRANQDSAIAGQITTLNSELDTAQAAITQEAITRAAQDSSLSSLINTLSAKLDDAEAAITQEAITRANQDSSLASSQQTISSNLAATNAVVTSQGAALATLEGYAASTYTIRTNAGGASAGFEIVAADDPINGPKSAIRFTADNILAIGTLTAPFIAAGAVTAEKIDVASLAASEAFIQNLTAQQAFIESLVVGTVQGASIVGDIDSVNFQPGVSGWRIRENGQAEFNNVVISRSLVLAQGSFAVNQTIQSGQEIEFPFVNTGIRIGDSDVWELQKVALVAVARVLPNSGGVPQGGSLWRATADVYNAFKWFGAAFWSTQTFQHTWSRDPVQLITPTWATGTTQRVMLDIKARSSLITLNAPLTVEWKVYQVT